jgi:hypothetical protein
MSEIIDPVWFFPFVGMATGDSFFIPTNNTDLLIYKVKNAATEYGIDIVVKARIEDGILGVRVWRAG